MNPPTRNLLFDRFEPRDDAFQRPALKEFKLEYNKILHEAGRPIELIYFHKSGVASMVKNMSDGNSAEVSTIGSEGVVGSPILFGCDNGPATVHVQVPGEGFRVPARVFREAIAPHAITSMTSSSGVHAGC